MQIYLFPIFLVNWRHNSLQGCIISKWDQNRAQEAFNDLLWGVIPGRAMTIFVKTGGFLLKAKGAMKKNLKFYQHLVN